MVKYSWCLQSVYIWSLFLCHYSLPNSVCNFIKAIRFWAGLFFQVSKKKMCFITWLYLIIETLHKLGTIIPRYIFIEEDFFQRKLKKWERKIVPSYQYIKWNIPVLKIEFGTQYNWLLFSKEPSTIAHHPSNQLTSLNRQQHSTLHEQVLRSICPLSGPLTLHHQTILSPLSTGKMNSTSSNHHLYIIKLSTLAGNEYTEWDLITVNYMYQSNLTN